MEPFHSQMLVKMLGLLYFLPFHKTGVEARALYILGKLWVTTSESFNAGYSSCFSKEKKNVIKRWVFCFSTLDTVLSLWDQSQWNLMTYWWNKVDHQENILQQEKKIPHTKDCRWVSLINEFEDRHLLNPNAYYITVLFYLIRVLLDASICSVFTYFVYLLYIDLIC